VIFVSKSLVNEYKNFIDNLNKISVIPNGINIKQLTENTNPRYFIHDNKLENKIILFSIGRIDKLKGFQKVIEIFPKLKEKYDNLIYLIAGKDGGFKKELQKLIKNKKLINSVQFLGYVNHQTKKNAFAAADLVLIPSLYEPFGIVILEAMGFGKPIISTKRGGIKEILKHEINGILINPSDQLELYDQIDKLLKNKELREKLGKEAKRSVQKFDWKKIIFKVNEIYNKVLNIKT
ncbi:MAG: glycosyltransferase family 4 protein, partial [Candidatus Hodarchaeota archaeon]